VPSGFDGLVMIEQALYSDVGLLSSLIGIFQSFSCHLEIVRAFTDYWKELYSCSPSQIPIKTAIKSQIVLAYPEI
jgi:hypothetical protein